MMKKIIAATAFGLVAVSNAQRGFGNTSSSACPSPGGAHIIVARGTTEAPGYGMIGAVKDMVLSQVPGSTAEAVVYPADYYFPSEATGVLEMKKLVAAFVANCQGTPLVLMGYSQGAQVTGDTMVGQDDYKTPFNASASPALDTVALNRIAAGILMGDPSFTVFGETAFHVGNATWNGIFPRLDSGIFDALGLTSRLKTYCNQGDPFCASGLDLEMHLAYVKQYGSDAADFVVDQIEDWYYQHKDKSGSIWPTPSSTSYSLASPTLSSYSVPGSTLTPAPSITATTNVASDFTTMISAVVSHALEDKV